MASFQDSFMCVKAFGMGTLMWVFYYVTQASFGFVMVFVPASQGQGLQIGCFVVAIWFVIYIYNKVTFPRN